MNIYADTVIINEGGDSFPGNVILTQEGGSPLGLSYNEVNAAVEAGRDVIVRHHVEDEAEERDNVYRLDSYGFADGWYFASFSGSGGHIEYRASGPDAVLAVVLK